jgi:hypothetical protein
MPPPSSLPETVRVEEGKLKINYHKYEKMLGDYADAYLELPVEALGLATMVFGPRRGFRELIILNNEMQEVFKISNNHKRLCFQICKILLDIKREIVRKGVENGNINRKK